MAEEPADNTITDDDAATDRPDDNATIKRMREELRKARADLAEARKTTAPTKIEAARLATRMFRHFPRTLYSHDDNGRIIRRILLPARAK